MTTVNIDNIEGSFSNATTAIIVFGAVTDIDGNVYKTIIIGNQEWMAENLKVTHYCNGDAIPIVTSKLAWANRLTSALYPGGAKGNFYNWHAVNDSRNIAPEGWHVPTDEEWKELEMFIGMSQSEADKIDYRGTEEGGRLKGTGTFHWDPPNKGATNLYGFNSIIDR